MVHINDKRILEIIYPVGENIITNLPRIRVYAEIIKEQNTSNKNIDIYCTGSSGAIIAAIIATELNCTIKHIKKDGEVSHSSQAPVFVTSRFNIIVDDIICTGSTIKNILRFYPNENFDLLIVSYLNPSLSLKDIIKNKVKKVISARQ